MCTELNYLRCINGELGPENHIKAFHNSRHALYVRRNEIVYDLVKCVIGCDSAHDFFSSRHIWLYELCSAEELSDFYRFEFHVKIFVS